MRARGCTPASPSLARHDMCTGGWISTQAILATVRAPYEDTPVQRKCFADRFDRYWPLMPENLGKYPDRGRSLSGKGPSFDAAKGYRRRAAQCLHQPAQIGMRAVKALNKSRYPRAIKGESCRGDDADALRAGTTLTEPPVRPGILSGFPPCLMHVGSLHLRPGRIARPLPGIRQPMAGAASARLLKGASTFRPMRTEK